MKKMADDFEWVRMERTFEAPIEKVWAMWTDPALFAQWYGPNGMTIPSAEMDVVVGGMRKICMEMTMPDKTMQMWFTGEYTDVSPHTRLAYTESMCDADGNIISQEGHPERTEVIVELSEAEGKSVMKMTHIGVPAGSPGAGGWSQAFDKLAAIL